MFSTLSETEIIILTTFNLPFANALNLNQSTILPFGKNLKRFFLPAPFSYLPALFHTSLPLFHTSLPFFISPFPFSYLPAPFSYLPAPFSYFPAPFYTCMPLFHTSLPLFHTSLPFFIPPCPFFIPPCPFPWSRIITTLPHNDTFHNTFRVQRIHSSAHIYKYKMGKDE